MRSAAERLAQGGGRSSPAPSVQACAPSGFRVLSMGLQHRRLLFSTFGPEFMMTSLAWLLLRFRTRNVQTGIEAPCRVCPSGEKPRVACARAGRGGQAWTLGALLAELSEGHACSGDRRTLGCGRRQGAGGFGVLGVVRQRGSPCVLGSLTIAVWWQDAGRGGREGRGCGW